MLVFLAGVRARRGDVRGAVRGEGRGELVWQGGRRRAGWTQHLMIVYSALICLNCGPGILAKLRCMRFSKGLDKE